jgi:hypothetical protein
MADNNDNGNPFDKPLNSELQEHQQQLAATIAASPNGNPFDEPLASEKAEAKAAQAGQVTNDVGNTVIVPKDGESFADTMARAVKQSQSTTQDQINRELATAPKKAAQVLAAAPAIGAGGVTALAAPGEMYGAAIEHLDQLTKVVKAAKALGWTSFGLKEAHDIYKMVAGDNKK